MSQITYQFGAIAAAAGDIASSAARITTMLADLQAQIRPMVATWEGDSATAYAAAQAKWDNSANELNAVLETIARTVSQGNDNMAHVNQRAAASWG